MAKLIIRKRAQSTLDKPIVWPGPDAKGRHVSYEYDWMNGETESEYGTRAMFQAMFGGDMGDAPHWIGKLACLYGATVLAKRRTGDIVTSTEWSMYKLARELDVEAMRLKTDIHKYMECNLKGGSAMSKKTGSKAKSSRVTASSVLIPILSRVNVPANDEIIDTVKSATGSDKFDSKQLAWYMWKFRQGKLKGQDGKLHVINQKSARKAAVKKAPKKAAKKVVVRKAKAVEAPAEEAVA